VIRTADLFDHHGERLQVCDPILRCYGRQASFHGPIRTVRAFEDNSMVRSALAQAAPGSVLVIDGGGSMRCALVGDRLAALAVDNGWVGIVVHGCIRDRDTIAALPIGIRALATTPARSRKRGEGEMDVTVRFAGVTFEPGHFLYADSDGIVVSADNLAPPQS
jgi:regulator of ribonuclease activity A